MTGYISGILYNPQGDLPPLTPNLPPNHEDLFRSVKIYGMNKAIKAPEVSGAFLLIVHTAGGYQ